MGRRFRNKPLSPLLPRKVRRSILALDAGTVLRIFTADNVLAQADPAMNRRDIEAGLPFRADLHQRATDQERLRDHHRQRFFARDAVRIEEPGFPQKSPWP